MDKHHREECEKVDRPRVQTSTHTIKVFSVQDKIENLQEELMKKLQEQQEVTEQRLQEQQQVTERLQEENSQVWVIIITMVVVLLIALVVGVSQEQTVTQQEFVSITQALNKSVAELEQETTFNRSVYCCKVHFLSFVTSLLLICSIYSLIFVHFQ